MSHVDKPADTREPGAIERDIEATRERLAGTIDQLVYRANPKTIARRQTDAVKGYFVDASGGPRTDNIVKVAGGVAGFVVLMLLVRKVAK